MSKKRHDSSFKQRLLEHKKRDRVIFETYKAHLVMALYTLHKDFGYGNKRLERFISAFNKNLNRYNDGELEYEQIKEHLEKKTKIKIE